MNDMKVKNSALIHLSIVLILTAIFTIFSISFTFLEEFYRLLGRYVGLSLAQYLVNAVFLLLIGLIWFTYRRWREWAETKKEVAWVRSSSPCSSSAWEEPWLSW